MAKVFRLHEGQSGSGWFISRPLTNDDLNTIKTDGREVASSIPTPFARIDLVKTAFKWVTDNEIDGNTAQHKLVSDALDIAQLFFIYPRHKDKFRIVAWKPQERFEALNNDEEDRIRKLAETLKITWEQDSVKPNHKNFILYNFERVHKLYFIQNKTNGLVIGGTSPATLFFAAPDARNAISPHEITCGGDRLLNTVYVPLNNRDFTFIEYLFRLAKQPNFPSLFPEVYAYLEKVRLNYLSENEQEVVTNLKAETISNYVPCPVLDNENNTCEVIGIPLKVIKAIENEKFDSDFLVSSDLPIKDVKPLVLPYERFNQKWKYTTAIWDENTKIPYKNLKGPNDSTLPVQGDHYYWLTIGNFLEGKIIKLPYNIDSEKFMTCRSKHYLLPLTPSFFKYFSADKVGNYLKINELSGGGLEAILEIPVKKGSIVFKKIYHQTDIMNIDIHLAILPFLTTNHIDIDYTIGVIDTRRNKEGHIDIHSYIGGKEININAPVVRNNGELKSYYYKINKTFDSIQVRSEAICGYIVPKMKHCEGHGNVHFAVDFGTTNTHIEYKYENNAEKAIDSDYKVPIWQSLLDINNTKDPAPIANDKVFEEELIPYQFNEHTIQKFPFRTALTYNDAIDFGNRLESFFHTNCFLLFERVPYPKYLKLKLELKWGDYSNPQDIHLVHSYIECLMKIVLYKTLLLGCNPKNTRITWFYPVSMDVFEQGVYREAWENAYKKLFKNTELGNLKAYPESIAPYLHYRANYPGLSLSLDIGGGSSDIAVFAKEENSPQFISSFKFAGNAIFGDRFYSTPYGNDSDSNGFVKTFLGAVNNVVGTNPQRDEILKDILNRRNSADFSSFLFSLERDPEVNFSYTNLLRQNSKLKLTILIYYGAVIYYSAQLMKKFGITTIPQNVLLSGTASKTASIIDSSQNLSYLSGLFKFIFQKVFQTTSNKGINIALSNEPKEITCKGVLRLNVNHQRPDSPIIYWIGGKENRIWTDAINKDTDVSKMPRYKDIDQTTESLIENSIVEFYSLLDNYFNEQNINNFGIDGDSYRIFKKMRTNLIKDYLRQGIRALNRNMDSHIEETLFFYPLTGVLNKLAFDLSQNHER